MNTAETSAMDAAAPISEQAAHWWVVLHDDACTSTDRRAFAEWIARSPERVEAYLRVTLLKQALESSDVRWPEDPADDLIRAANAAPAELRVARAPAHAAIGRPSPPPLPAYGERVGVRGLPPLPLGERVGVRGLRLAAIAATLLLAIAATWFFLADPRSYRTDVGEQRSVLLDDGSLIMLNTSSEIEVDLTKERRLIRLIEGEALFRVAHDVKRPFDVIAGDATIRAVGTQFNVDRRAARTTVTVLEGRVLVEQVPVAAAERVIVTASRVSAPERIANVAPVTAWTQRRLVFERRPLGEVAEEFNRYNRRQIRIDDPELEREEVTGVFEANDAASFVAFLEEIPNVRVTETQDGGHVVTVGGPN